MTDNKSMENVTKFVFIYIKSILTLPHVFDICVVLVLRYESGFRYNGLCIYIDGSDVVTSNKIN
jgi:hypothetical protein